MINECVSKLSELCNHQVSLTVSSSNELRMHGVMFHSALDTLLYLYVFIHYTVVVCHSDYDSAVIMHSKLYSKHIQW